MANGVVQWKDNSQWSGGMGRLGSMNERRLTGEREGKKGYEVNANSFHASDLAFFG